VRPPSRLKRAYQAWVGVVRGVVRFGTGCFEPGHPENMGSLPSTPQATAVGLCNMPLPMNIPASAPDSQPFSMLAAERWPAEAFATVDVAALMQGQPLPVGVPARALWRQACADVARDHGNLEAHVRRVLLAGLQGRADRVFDALVDCFLALGTQGLALRQSLLSQARALLDDDSFEFLDTHLEPGLSRSDALPTHAASLLDPGLIGLPVLVRRLEPLPFDAALVPVDLDVAATLSGS